MSKIDVWLDFNTDIMWQLDIEDKLFTWYEANEYVAQFNKVKYGGFDNWRLPTIGELEQVNGYKNLDIAWKYKEKNIDTKNFLKAFFWSATLLKDNMEKAYSISPGIDPSQKAWNININTRATGYDDLSDRQSVRLCRNTL